MAGAVRLEYFKGLAPMNYIISPYWGLKLGTSGLVGEPDGEWSVRAKNGLARATHQNA